MRRAGCSGCRRWDLKPGPSCRPEDVKGWTVGRCRGGWDLHNPQDEDVSPNCAPGDVRDSFRAFMRNPVVEG